MRMMNPYQLRCMKLTPFKVFPSSYCLRQVPEEVSLVVFCSSQIFKQPPCPFGITAPLLSSLLHRHHLVSAVTTVAEHAGCPSRSKYPLFHRKEM